jgi:hypothetical protein
MENEKEEYIGTDDWEILTPSGWQSFKGIICRGVNEVNNVITESSKKIKVTDNHEFINQLNHTIKCIDAKNCFIKTVDGTEKITSILSSDAEEVYDIVEVENGNIFYANGIANHNCHLVEEFWNSVIPVISSGKKTKIFVVSTPNGVANKFYEIYSGAEKDENGWKAERIDWWEIPGRTEKWKAQMIGALGSAESFNVEFGNCVEGLSILSININNKIENITIKDLYETCENRY